MVASGAAKNSEYIAYANTALIAWRKFVPSQRRSEENNRCAAACDESQPPGWERCRRAA